MYGCNSAINSDGKLLVFLSLSIWVKHFLKVQFGVEVVVQFSERCLNEHKHSDPVLKGS